MTVTMREVGSEDFQPLVEELFHHLDPRVPPEQWRALLEVPWHREGFPRGHVLLDAGRPVGYLGLLVAPPGPEPKGSPVCNLTSWIVLPEYRGHSLRLLGPVLSNREWTFTNLTPTPEVAAVFGKLGFERLETHRVLLPPWPSHFARGAGRTRVSEVAPGRGTELGTREATPSGGVAPGRGEEGAISSTGRRVVEGAGPHARVVRVEGADGCEGFLAFSIRRLRGIRTARIHHASDPALVAGEMSALRRYLLTRHGTCMVAFDRRLLPPSAVEGGRVRALPVPRLFRSPDRSPSQLTELYSEFVLLDL